MGTDLRVAVLDVDGYDPEQEFSDCAGDPGEGAHAPVACHAFAACTGGSFHRSERTIPAGTTAVVLLIGEDLKACRRALLELRRASKTVAVLFRETNVGISSSLANPADLRLFQEICRAADGAIVIAPDLVQFFAAAGARHTELLPLPYPVDDPRWDFSMPSARRHGIFIGTRDLSTPARNHLAALLAIRQPAESLREPVTVIDTSCQRGRHGRRARRLFEELGWPDGLLRVVRSRLPYARYLELMAGHKLVFQLDQSAAPGQVAGDALLCRIPCVGGNGTIERLVFPDLCGHGRTTGELVDIAVRRLEHPSEADAAVAQASSLAARQISFAVLRRRLTELFQKIAPAT